MPRRLVENAGDVVAALSAVELADDELIKRPLLLMFCAAMDRPVVSVVVITTIQGIHVLSLESVEFKSLYEYRSESCHQCTHPQTVLAL
jgi:hypothetical protein